MAIDLQGYKVQVFTDVNDTPTAPTATTPGNGSHLIRQYNNLIEEVQSEFNGVTDDIADIRSNLLGNWKVVEEDYLVQGGDTIFVKNNQPGLKTTYFLYALETPQLGTTFSYMSANPSIQVELRTYENDILWVSTSARPIKVHSVKEFELITLVYLGTGYNWYQVAGTPLIKEFAPS